MQEPAITQDLIAAHGLSPDEYDRILDIIGREPTFTELGIFSAMWNEHCSYKSSKKWLRMRRRAWAASCAMYSPWAHGPSRQ